MTDPIVDMRDFIDGESSLPWTKGDDLLIGALRPEPIRMLAISQAAGTSPKRTMGDKTHFRRAVVEILIRDTTFYRGHTDASNLLDTLQGASISGFEDVVAQESEPAYLGQDESGHHRWQLNVEMVYTRNI